jgi:hypothetical protein
MKEIVVKLFKSLMQIDDSQRFVEFVIQNPVLLSPFKWRDIWQDTSLLSGQDKQEAKLQLQRLQALYEYFRDLSNYPFGEGPIESIYVRCIQGEISLNSACNQAASSNFYTLLSPIYVLRICMYAEQYSQRNSTGWDKSQKLLAILLKSVESIPENNRNIAEWFEMWSSIVLANLEVATSALIDVPDKRVLIKAVNLGEKLIEDSKAHESSEIVAKALHRLGVLYLDPWFSGKPSKDYLKQFFQWQKRLYDAYGVKLAGLKKEDIEMPQPIEAINKSIGYFEKAHPYLEGNAKAYTLKALSEAYMWKNIVQGTNDYQNTIKLAEEALDLFEPKQYFSKERIALQNRISFCKEQHTSNPDLKDEQLIVELLERSPDELVKDHGLNSLFYLFRQSIDFSMQNNDYECSLKLWEKAQIILSIYNSEEVSSNHYQVGIKLMEKTLADPFLQEIRSFPSSELYETLRKRYTLSPISEPSMYATLLLVAFYTTSKNDEEIGIKIINDVSEKAFNLEKLKPFTSLINFMAAHLYLNSAVNSVEAKNILDGIEKYFRAMKIFISLRYVRAVQDLMQRIEDLCMESDLKLLERVVVHISFVALDIENLNELSLSQSCQSIYKLLFQRITLTPQVNPVTLTFITQLAKGYTYSSMLQLPFRRDFLQKEEAQIIIARIKELSAQTANSLFLTKNNFLDNENLMVSFVGSLEQREGVDVETRIQNLKISLDKYIYKNLLAELNEVKDLLLSPDEIQSLLPKETVLISQFLGPSAHGFVSVYNLIFTREEVFIVNNSIGDIPSSNVNLTENELSVEMPFLGLSIADRRKQIQEEPETDGLTREAATSMQDDANYFLGGSFKDLLAKFKANGKSHLCIWPHGPLHYYPFHLLPVSNQPICNDWIVSYIPNIGILSRAKKKRPIHHSKVLNTISALGISFTINNPNKFPPYLPNSIKEVEAISNIFNVSPIVENNVTEQAFINAMLSSRWVHLSTHGLFDVSAPSFHCLILNEDKNSDGILNAYELLNYCFDHVELLTLSACETALGRFDYSDNIRGLPAMFLQMGVKTIIGTLWNAESGVCELFFLTLYTELNRGISKLNAFNLAQQKTKNDYPDYRDWGAFYFSGEIS